MYPVHSAGPHAGPIGTTVAPQTALSTGHPFDKILGRGTKRKQNKIRYDERHAQPKAEVGPPSQHTLQSEAKLTRVHLKCHHATIKVSVLILDRLAPA